MDSSSEPTTSETAGASDAEGVDEVAGHENDTVIADDTMSLQPVAGGGTEVTYRAEFTFKGVGRIVAPLLWPAFRRLANGAEVGLRTALARL